MKSLLCSYFCFVYFISTKVSGYVFDKESCDTMLPRINHNETDLGVEILTDSSTPYKITVNAIKYRRNRRLKVRLDGGEFNGIFLQARQYTTRREGEPTFIGTFVDFSSFMATLDCGRGPNYSVSNAIYFHNSSITRKSVDIHWQGPTDDVGSIEFIATVIFGTKYRNPVKSSALLFNEFPPSLSGCGVDQSCYQYIPIGGTDSEYTMVATVVNGDVVFVIGGIVNGDSGYIGIGFTNATMEFVDMCVCVKTNSKTVVAAHYVRVKNKKPNKINEMLEDAETDLDNKYVWCKFRRPLKAGKTKVADLTYALTPIMLRGELDSEDRVTPIYPKDSDVVDIAEPWNYTSPKNVIHYKGGSNLAGISWTLISAALLATLIELCRL